VEDDMQLRDKFIEGAAALELPRRSAEKDNTASGHHGEMETQERLPISAESDR
jgi:hypothetical protein